MALVLVNDGEARMLTNYFADNMTLHLFTNDYTPVKGSVAVSFTEAAGNNYSAIALAGGAGWVQSGNNPRQAAFAEQTFTFTGALGNVYGYHITRDTDGLVMFAERFTGAPFNVVNNGDQIKVTPRFTIQ